jgi:hypothetical protein
VNAQTREEFAKNFDDNIETYEHNKEPTTSQEAMPSNHAEEWKHAMQEELSSFEDNNTWELCDLPQGRRNLHEETARPGAS